MRSFLSRTTQLTGRFVPVWLFVVGLSVVALERVDVVVIVVVVGAAVLEMDEVSNEKVLSCLLTASKNN